MANDFDEAAARKAGQNEYSRVRNKSKVPGHNNMSTPFSISSFVSGARYQHSLMQERLDVVGKESLEINGRLLKENAQLSATCERYRSALSEALEIVRLDPTGKSKWMIEKVTSIATKALESGERGGV